MKAVYKVADIVHLGLQSLTVHKVRSVLTALGILCGVWSVIAMLAISEGASRQSQLHLREMGSDNIIIRSIKPSQDASATDSTRGAMVYGLTYGDVESMKGNLPRLRRCVVTHQTARPAYANGGSFQVTLIGTEPAYAQVVQIKMAAGRFLRNIDILRHKPHCVITQSMAARRFPCQDALGQIVRVLGEPLLVVGVLEHLPRLLSEGGVDAERCVILPLSTDRSRFSEFSATYSQGSYTAERVEVSQVIFQMEDEKAVVEGAAIARSLLERRRSIPDYEIKVPRELLEQMAKQSRLWSIVFMVIASVSLLVGGIGIMNIMLASVTERTREIGIRRALGAKRADIVTQFLVEAVTLTTVGGAVGIAFGKLVPWVVANVLPMQFTPVVLPSTLVVPFVMAVAVGLASGLYPAVRAARLDPIVALRHE